MQTGRATRCDAAAPQYDRLMELVGQPRELPYARGEILRGTEDDFAKLQLAWARCRAHADGTLFDFTGLVRSMLAAATS